MLNEYMSSSLAYTEQAELTGHVTAEAKRRCFGRAADTLLTDTLHRGGFTVLPSSAPSRHMFSPGSNLLQRLHTSSRCSEARSDFSANERVMGVDNVDNGRHSRRSGRSSHSAAKLRHQASSMSLDALLGHGSSRRAISSMSSNHDGSFKSLRPFSSTGSNHDGSFLSSLRDTDTPPGATDAFEAHKALVLCPPPLRSQLTRAVAHRVNADRKFPTL
jgi:hypothetical protein